ncbi:aminoacyl-tRNA hydrolase [bacterium]|nr:aminoacyl-tRNA hydrolase [bacterium]
MHFENLYKIDPDEIRWDFIRASGPGGQNVNKVATAVQLRFHVDSSLSLPEEVRQRLKKLAGSRMTREGDLVITAQRFRSQVRNRADALERLNRLVEKALIKPVIRKPTKPGPAAHQKRLEAKKRQAEKKRNRAVPDF